MPPEKILRIATRQKILLTCFALLLFCTVLTLWTQAPAFKDFFIPVAVAYQILVIVLAIYTILLLIEVENKLIIAVLAALFLFVPCLNVLILVAVNMQATKILKEHGVSVGFSGVNLKRLKERLAIEDHDGK